MQQTVYKNTSYREAYRLYLQTDHWKHIRLRALHNASHLCESCGHNRRLEAHHMDYRSLIDCTEADLVVLCERCHDYLHSAFRINGTRSNLYNREETIGLIHSFCRTQGAPLGKQNFRSYRNLIIASYRKCRKQQYTKKALERLLTELRAVHASMP